MALTDCVPLFGIAGVLIASRLCLVDLARGYPLETAPVAVPLPAQP